ncbi:putative sodium-dependent bicarbonate transporter [Alkalibacterium sp. AK22]|uniref:sodium-dependent bicarbonate transport family permease n=1 Tax=Alkalibacterium sp. AK22 TaxID=1229520 RepID=UPI00044A8780|nr:sodium-dependent bicarbonate transport family permease [Alkalibacterium sp. AK22]EXJ22982.1 putative sodium-dependent bicarbonate transporter [Alkalibacterium sp. AK22]
MNALHTTLSNLSSPAVLFFILGILAAAVKSDLRIPDSLSSGITMYILLSIGLRGGIAVSEKGIGNLFIYIIAAVAIGVVVTCVAYFAMTKTGLDSSNAGSIAGHYGACSSVTITASLVFLQQTGAHFEEFVPALYPFMDTAALLTAITLGHIGLKKETVKEGDNEHKISTILKTSLTGRSTLLIMGSFMIGLLSGAETTEALLPFYNNLFSGIFTLFMLDIGILTGSRLHEINQIKPVTFFLALVLPPLHAGIALTVAMMVGLGPGGSTVLAALASGASVITAPAVMKDTFPKANPSLALAIALGIIFPFNILLGIPLYYQWAMLIG